jgi:hypothetical protein
VRQFLDHIEGNYLRSAQRLGGSSSLDGEAGFDLHSQSQLDAASPLEAAYAWIREEFGLQGKSDGQALQAVLDRLVLQDIAVDEDAMVEWLRDGLGLEQVAAVALAHALRVRVDALGVLDEAEVGSSAALEGDYAAEYGGGDEVEGGQMEGQGKMHSPEVQALLPWLRKRLGMADADVETILREIVAHFQEGHPNADCTAEEFAGYLRATYPMAAQARNALAAALEEFAAGFGKKEVGASEQIGGENGGAMDRFAGESGRKDEFRKGAVYDSRVMLNDGVDSSGDGDAGKKEKSGSEVSPELMALLPWLRQRLGVVDTSIDTILATLLEYYAGDYPDGEVAFEAIASWLRGTYPMAADARSVLAEAMVSFAIGKVGEKHCLSLRGDNVQNGSPGQNELEGQAELLDSQLAQGELKGQKLVENQLALDQSEEKIEKPITQNTPPPKPFRWTHRKAGTQSDELPWLVYNAGLVIFWPFLQRFFQYQGLVEDKAFVSPDAQAQAVCLLQQMVSPEGDWNEGELALAKVLCGLPPDALVDPGCLPPPTDGSDTQLIEAVMAHWNLAGNLSPAAFRQAWLCRKGTLRIRDSHWILRVEEMAHDILLEGLPWDIAYIMLSWMPHELYVNWGEKAKMNL